MQEHTCKGLSKNKVADIAAANLSGNGVEIRKSLRNGKNRPSPDKLRWARYLSIQGDGYGV